MKNLIIAIMLCISTMAFSQTEVRINFEIDLVTCEIELLSSSGESLPLNDVTIHNSNEISMYLDVDSIYTIVIDKTYYIDIFPIPESKTTLHASLSYDDMKSGFADIHPGTESSYLALKATNKKAKRRLKRRLKKHLKRGYKKSIKNQY